MVTITVTLSDDRLQKLQELAKQFRIPPEELVRISVEELIARPQADFQKALDYTLKKNENSISDLPNALHHCQRSAWDLSTRHATNRWPDWHS